MNMDYLRRKINSMAREASYSEVGDGDYLEVLGALFEHLKFAQERIVELERRVDAMNMDEEGRVSK